MASSPTGIFGNQLKALVDYGSIELAPGKNVANSLFLSQEPYWSTAYFGLPVDAAGINTITAGTFQNMFSGKIGDPSGTQGGNWRFTAADTNNSIGTALPINQVYLATSASISIGCVDSTGVPVRSLSPFEVDGVSNSLYWTFMESGDRARNLGLACMYPSGTGVYSTGISASQGFLATGAPTAMQSFATYGESQNGGPVSNTCRLAVPIVLRPLRNYEQTFTFARACTFAGSSLAGITSPFSDSAVDTYVYAKLELWGFRFNVA